VPQGRICILAFPTRGTPVEICFDILGIELARSRILIRFFLVFWVQHRRVCAASIGPHVGHAADFSGALKSALPKKKKKQQGKKKTKNIWNDRPKEKRSEHGKALNADPW